MDLNEAQTRAAQINPQLERMGWNLADHAQVRFEVPVAGYDPKPWNGFTDYCLYDADDSVIAVIEAKKTVRNPGDGEEQLRQYIDEITKKQGVAPFGFMTNGLHHYFWEVGLAHPRMVSGFFTPDDMRRLKFIRDNKKSLRVAPINKTIVERSYQLEAIRRVAEAFEAGILPYAVQRLGLGSQPLTSVAEYGWVTSPVKAGLRPPPRAAAALTGLVTQPVPISSKVNRMANTRCEETSENAAREDLRL